MKNFLIVVLLVAVVVLGVLLYQKTRTGGGSKPGVGKVVTGLRTPGQPHDDRKDYKGNPVKTKDCDYLLGKDMNVCIVPLDYVDHMKPNNDDRALEVHANDLIVWIGDTGEVIGVHQLQAVNCDGSPDPNAQNLYLTDGPFPLSAERVGHVQFGHVSADNNTHQGHCFKTTIDATDLQQGKKRQVDPHMFDGGP